VFAHWPSIFLSGEHISEVCLGQLRRSGVRELLPLGRSGVLRAVEVAGDDPLSVIVAMAVSEDLDRPLILSATRAEAHPQQGVARLRVNAADECDCLLGDGGPLPSLHGDARVVFETSGTEAAPRQVMISRAGLDYQARATADRLQISKEDGCVLPLSVSHAYGFSVLLTAAAVGATVYIEKSPRGALERVASGSATTLDGVPAIYRYLVSRVRVDSRLRRRVRELRLCGCGGDLLGSGLASEFQELIGSPIHDGYGLAEAGPNVSLASPRFARPGTVGKPLPQTEVRIDSSSEILVWSPSVMLGYLGAPELTQEALRADGRLRTGDLGRVDADGFLTVTGRKKHVLLVNGETHSPAVIEDVVCRLPGVVEAVAVGLPADHRRGDRIVVFAQRESPQGPSGEEVERACRSLTPSLRPQEVRMVEALPRTLSGKPDRTTLRRLAAKWPTRR
jgi:acyl-CoA synthetase (AMP-forming)/AMP-acid ligase II